MNLQNARIVLEEFNVVLHSSEAIAPVGILHPLSFHLENKVESYAVSGIDQTSEISKEKVGFVFEVEEDCQKSCEVTCQAPAEVPELDEVAEHRLQISRTRSSTSFSICCWLQDSSKTSKGMMILL